MEELKNLVKLWCSVLVSLCYSYGIGLAIPKGMKRLILIVPIICLFLYLPLLLSSVNFSGLTSFMIAWIANFKLLLFAFGKGPLSSDPPIPLLSFIALAALPIQIKEKSHQNTKSDHKTPLNYAVKIIIAAIVLQINNYSHKIHPYIMVFINVTQMYVCLELALAVMAGLAQFVIGLDLEPQFNEPYLATSLQEFWSRRWNRMVPIILKPTVYEPVRSLATRVVGRKWAPVPAIFGTFFVSALMHELVFYHLGREMPNWDLTWFFLIQGFTVAAEVAFKKLCGERWHLPPLISWCFTMAFIFITGRRFFLPQLHRCNAFERGNVEYGAVMNFIQNSTKNFRSVI
ncbi:acyl-CoA--sterol O-acyltransferase 1-like [Euphorbia lathyris]|uniref:acyl-CoA--sterol O-acyltransferase 1-like n=1 Tax=Euphorbia lathyris TaxID=212925 RepID=UPI0033130E80